MRCFAVRLLVVVALAAVVVPIENGATTARAAFPGYSGLIAFARGRAHHRGDDVGSGALGRSGAVIRLAPMSGQEGAL